MFSSLTRRSAAGASLLLRARAPAPVFRSCVITRLSPLTPIRTVHNPRLRSPPRSSSQSRHPGFFGRLNYLLNLWRTSPTFRVAIIGFGGASGAFYITHLETVPGSGRRRFNCIGPETEKELAKDSLNGVLQAYRGKVLPEWAPETRMVQNVLERLIPNSGIADGEQWEVRVVREDEANAFVLPGNKVFVCTGILPICQNEDGLAAVLGHEISHNLAHHSAENLSRLSLFILGVVAVVYLTGFTFDFSTLLLDYVYNKPGSRKQESEADYLGLMMMAKSCYDPEEGVRLWQRMEKARGRGMPQFLSTHPSNRRRIEDMKMWLPEAREKRGVSECGFMIGSADEFREAVAGFGSGQRDSMQWH